MDRVPLEHARDGRAAVSPAVQRGPAAAAGGGGVRGVVGIPVGSRGGAGCEGAAHVAGQWALGADRDESDVESGWGEERAEGVGAG